MASQRARGDSKQYLSKNKSVRLFKQKKQKRDEYARERQELINQYEKLDVSAIESFDQLPLTSQTRKGLKKCNYHSLTEIQQQTIGLALKSHDILGAAKTGSGKTLAFVVPILERLYCEGWCKTDGLGALIITPTRELALQIFHVFQNVGSFHDFTIGLVIGGKDIKQERKILHLYNIVICCPGRFLMHLDKNVSFHATNLKILVLDEADRILDEGFQKEVNAILEHLADLEKQTLLFSATQTKSVKDLARLNLKNPMYVSVHEHAKHATPEALEQSFLVCELHRKIDFLWSFLKSHPKQKILIFMASCKQVKYTFDAFCRLKPGTSLTALFGGMNQIRRIERYQDFCRKKHVVMFATDIAARGLDFPDVNWVVQLDCPENINTYIHRAGRTARYQKGGESLLVLLPNEKESMIQQLNNRKIPINEIKVHPKKLMSIQRKMELQCARDPSLRESARRAFLSYYKNIYFMKDRTVFDLHKILSPEVKLPYAKSLGLTIDPRNRFIEKHLKVKVVAKADGKIDQNAKDSLLDNNHLHDDDQLRQELKITLDEDSASDDDDFLAAKVKETKQTDLLLPDTAVGDDELMQNISSSRTHKPLTKAAVAKKILKKNIIPNVKIRFDEEGETIGDAPKKIKGEISSELAEGGFSFEKSKLIQDQEDAVDRALYRTKIKEKHKQRRQKLKEQRRIENSSNSAQLDENKDKDEDEAASSGSDIDPNNISNSDNDLESDNGDDKWGKNDSTSDNLSEGDSSKDEDELQPLDNENENNLKRKYVSEKIAFNSSKKLKLKHIEGTSNKHLQSALLEDEENLALHFLTNS